LAGLSRHQKRSRSEKIFIFLGLLVVVSMVVAPLVTLLLYRQPVVTP
jgi:hypothetical protein